MERNLRPRRGPGPVAAAHRILIATALAGAIFFALWELREYGRTGGRDAAVAAALGFTAAGVMGVYFRTLRGLGSKLSPRRDGAGEDPR